MRALLDTAGERVEVTCAVPWISAVLTEGAAGQLAADDGTAPGVRITVEHESAAFGVDGWRVLTRDAWCRPGQVIIRDACSSGLDLRVTADGTALEVTARWRPSGKGRVATALLRSRARLLLRAVLLQYPALWRGQSRGRAPLHASVCGLGGGGDGRTILLAGPGGVGKSTLVYGELLAGGASTCDNLCVSDGRGAWGVLEPLRLPAGVHQGSGRRMPHGRREMAWPRRTGEMRPGLLVVVSRGGPAVASCEPELAARYLTAGTYMAGELRRYWSFAATLALGTGLGSSHPPVEEAAARLSRSVPCLRVALGDQPGAPLRELLGAAADAEVSA